MFRKDVGTFVRLDDFMSQIIDCGDPELEKRQIYLRHLQPLIQANNYTALIDLSGVSLRVVKQVDRGGTDISLGECVDAEGPRRALAMVDIATLFYRMATRESVG